MRKTVTLWLIAALVLVVLGCVLFVGVMVAYGGDFSKLSTVNYVTNTYEINETFDKIAIDVDTTDIHFVPAENGKCRIVCFELEKAKHSVVVQNGTLSIHTVDMRKWYEYIGITLGTPQMTVYLPTNTYSSLSVETDTGDITIPKNFSFERLHIDGDTSDIACFASVSNTLEIEVSTGRIHIEAITADRLDLTTTTGDIQVNSTTVNMELDVETNTGKVQLTEASCKKLTAESDTGAITLKRVIVTDSLSIESDTGNVRLENSDAAQLSIKTSTGDVTGTLLSEKNFITETSTGKVRVPKTTSGGKCEITTSTGDIILNVTS